MDDKADGNTQKSMARPYRDLQRRVISDIRVLLPIVAKTYYIK